MIYNAAFDVSFLERAAKNCGIEFPEIKVKDILATARSRIKDIKDYRLDTVAAKLRIDMHNRHRAVDDCRLLNEVFHKLNEIQ